MGESKKYVVYGMMAKCSEGTMENYISTDKGHGVVYQGQPVLNANDHQKGVNLTHFGDCNSKKIYEEAKKEIDEKYKAEEGDGFFTKLGKGLVKAHMKTAIFVQEHLMFHKCELDTPLPWIFTSKDHMIDGAPALTMESQCACRYGGIITIVQQAGEDSTIGTTEDVEMDNLQQSQMSITKIKELASKWNIEIGEADWNTLDFVRREMSPDGHEFRMKKRRKFIEKYSKVIEDAANEFDIPVFLMAGVVFNEYSGKPESTDNIAYFIRGIDWSGPDWIDEHLTITKNPDVTSFGHVSMQIRRAAETLGMDSENMSYKEKAEIIELLKDPVANIYIAAKHLQDLKEIDYSSIPSENLTDTDIKSIATRFNRGPDLTKEEITNNLIHGETMYANKDFIIKAMGEQNEE